MKTTAFKGKPMTLVGRQIKTGAPAPDFRAVLQDLTDIRLSNYKNRVVILTSFPSLDTPVCDLQVKEFNKRATTFSANVLVIGLSKDLPFAQHRFCEANDIKNVIVASDYKYSSFGINYGLLIKELNLLARSVLIVDSDGILRYAQIVEELTNPPDYDAALRQLQNILSAGVSAGGPAPTGVCRGCVSGALPLASDVIRQRLQQGNGWELIDGEKIRKQFKFKDFVEAKYFLDLVGIVAEDQGHHPDLTLNYNKLDIVLTTHSAGGLTENDFVVAKIIDELG